MRNPDYESSSVTLLKISDVKKRIFKGSECDKALLAIEIEDEIYRFIKGLQKPRLNPVTIKQIEKHLDKYHIFKNVDIDNALDQLLTKGKISIFRLSLQRRIYGYNVV